MRKSKTACPDKADSLERMSKLIPKMPVSAAGSAAKKEDFHMLTPETLNALFPIGFVWHGRGMTSQPKDAGLPGKWELVRKADNKNSIEDCTSLWMRIE